RRRRGGGGRRQLRHLRDPLTPQTPKKAPHRNRCGASTRLMLRGSPPATRAPDQQFAPAHTGPLTPFPPPTPTVATVAAAADATSGRAAWCRSTGPRPGRCGRAPATQPPAPTREIEGRAEPARRWTLEEQ